jgi:hypothetical protein
MKTRPTSVTVISWILIVAGGISLISTTAMINNPMTRELMSKSLLSVPAQYAITYLGLLITIVSGIMMLKGYNWARLLYVIWGTLGFMVGLITSPMKTAMIPGLIVFVVAVIFLFRPTANSYFSPAEPGANA